MVKIDKVTNVITATRGDTIVFRPTLTLDGVEYVPEDGDVIRFALKRDEEDSVPYIRKVIPHDPMVCIIEPQDTKELDYGTYRYDVELTTAAGFVTTFISSKIKLTWEAD